MKDEDAPEKVELTVVPIGTAAERAEAANQAAQREQNIAKTQARELEMRTWVSDEAFDAQFKAALAPTNAKLSRTQVDALMNENFTRQEAIQIHCAALSGTYVGIGESS